MTQEKQHDIALMRYSVISPIINGLSEEYSSLDAFYRDAAKKGTAFFCVFAACCMHSLRSHTCALRSVFRHVHAAPKNESHLLSPQAAKLYEILFV